MNTTPSRQPQAWFLGLLTVGFTIALTFASIELPRWLTRLADQWIDIPDYHPYIEPDAIETFLQSARPIGYASLAIVLVLICVGFVLGRRAPSTVGAILLFLPTFGYFAGYMFFLAGLGALRALWLPAWEDFLHLGDIAYLPYIVAVWPLWQIGIDAREAVAYTAIAAGVLVFVLSTLAWFLSRSRGSELVDSWPYRWSRHPQYLGWILWTYGVMLLAGQAPVPMGGSNPGASLPWIISTLVIVCVALHEEARMRRNVGAEYESYRATTPFLFPLPTVARRVLRAPLRLVSRARYPGSGRQIAAVFLLYLALTMSLSVPFVAAKWPPGLGWSDWPDTRVDAPAPEIPDVPVEVPIDDE